MNSEEFGQAFVYLKIYNEFQNSKLYNYKNSKQKYKT